MRKEAENQPKYFKTEKEKAVNILEIEITWNVETLRCWCLL